MIVHSTTLAFCICLSAILPACSHPIPVNAADPVVAAPPPPIGGCRLKDLSRGHFAWRAKGSEGGER